MKCAALLTRRNLAVLAITFGLVATTGSAVPSAHAAPRQDEAAHQQLCKDLYLIYDTNMDTHYDKSKSAAERQQAYEDAQQALSDFRQQGCKLADVTRIQQVQSTVSLGTGIQDVAPNASSDSPLPGTSAPLTSRLNVAR
jgi:hypothetical protein